MHVACIFPARALEDDKLRSDSVAVMPAWQVCGVRCESLRTSIWYWCCRRRTMPAEKGARRGRDRLRCALALVPHMRVRVHACAVQGGGAGGGSGRERKHTHNLLKFKSGRSAQADRKITHTRHKNIPPPACLSISEGIISLCALCAWFCKRQEGITCDSHLARQCQYRRAPEYDI